MGEPDDGLFLKEATFVDRINFWLEVSLNFG